MASHTEGALVALRLPAGPAFVGELRRIWDAGGAVLPLSANAPDAELRATLARLRPAELVDERGRTRLPDAPPVAPGTAAVIATSGSTGRPKGVVLSHRALRASARASLRRLDADGDDRWLCCLPVWHVAGLQVLVRSWLLGTAAAVHPRFDPGAVAAETGASMVALVPGMLRALLDAGADVSRFRRILLGGAAAPAALLARARASGARVVTGYGMTETAGGCVYDGVPLDGVEVALGADRRIRVRGPVLLSGYRDASARQAPVVRDGWFTTADLGGWSADGRLQVHGRADDVIVTGGENVAAAEVAELLSGHPEVAEVVVAGRPDERWGQRVVAFVVPADPARPPDLPGLRRFVAERAAAYKAPRQLVLVERLPRSALGKPLVP